MVWRERGEQVYFEDPYSFVRSGFDFHGHCDTLVQIPGVVKKPHGVNVYVRIGCFGLIIHPR